MFSSSDEYSTRRPLPLKQRTSSLDTRRDYSHNTWWSLLVLLKLREFFVTVDNFSIWRRHLAWAMESGKDLRAYMTQRYGSCMVFMSLLLSTELGILFNSAPVTTRVRETLREGNHNTISFWAGFTIIISALMTVLSLIATFTAWGMVNSINEVNAHCIFRSSIGQYAAELPGRLIVCSIYFFLISFMMFFFLLLPVGQWSIILSAMTVCLFVHIVSVFSSFGRIIMHTGAMGDSRIFTPEYENFLLPHTLHSNLLTKAQANLANNTSIIRQYRRKQQPIDRHLTPDTMYDHLSGNIMEPIIPGNIAYRPRADSTVRFADEKGTSGNGGTSHNSSLYDHNRTLTALSDSSLQISDRSTLLAEDRPTPTYSSLRKSSFSGPPRPRPSQQYQRVVPVPPPPLSVGSENVSASSLEQWLQPAPSPSLGQDGGNPNRPPTSAMDSGPDHNRSTIKRTNRHISPIDPRNSNTTTHSRQPASTNTNIDSSSRLSPVDSSSDRLTPVHSELSFDDRDLSEDERFALDYGEIDDGDSSQHFAVEYRILARRTSLDTPAYEPPSIQPPGNDDDGFNGSPNEERRGLLD